MNTKASIPFSFTRFDISACHFGRATKQMPSKGAMLSQLIHGFCEWVEKAKHLSDTRIDDGESEIYVKDVAEDKGRCCVVLWNKTGSGRTSLAVSKNSPPKTKGVIQKKKFDKDFIPGEPLYYLVEAERVCLWTIRPPLAQRTERTALERAFRFYMGTHSEYFDKSVGKKRTTENDHVVELVPSDKNIQKKLPRFSAKMTRNEQKLDALVARASSIRKLVHVVSFKDMDQQKRSVVVSHLLDIFAPSQFSLRQAEDTKRVKYEIDVKVDASEIRKLVARQENMKNSRIGFVVKGATTPIWADETILRFERALLLPAEDEVFSAEDLLKESSSIL